MKFEFSAGGVVYKKDKTQLFILIAQHSLHHGWGFPKGLIGDTIKGEKKEETAVREVKEETGIEGEIVHTIDPVTYWYKREGETIKKTVYYFVMEYKGGSFETRDKEMEAVEWVAFNKIEERLTFKSDKEVFKQAKEYILKLAK